MTDYNFITTRLATGGALTGPEDVDQLIVDRITAVIDCSSEVDDAPLFAQARIVYLWNGTPDDGKPKPAEWFKRSLEFALPLLAKPHMRVLAHCTGGVQRGPSTAYCILRALGYTAPTAEAVIRAARPGVGLAYRADADAAVQALGYE